jgi:hypothetical protein
MKQYELETVAILIPVLAAAPSKSGIGLPL